MGVLCVICPYMAMLPSDKYQGLVYPLNQVTDLLKGSFRPRSCRRPRFFRPIEILHRAASARVVVVRRVWDPIHTL